MKPKLLTMSFAVILTMAGCTSGSGTPSGEGGSGGSGSGGQGQSGGTNGGSGGKVGSGGNPGSGGASGTGGVAGNGSGGAETGGKTGSGGAGNGGKTGSGGAGNGGTTGGGGAGSSGTTGGGGVGAGGTLANGGATGSSGISGKGGGTGPGGTTGAGGGTAKGGAGGGVGGSEGGTVGASGYPAAGASGQAAPTGTGSKVTVLPWAGFKGAISFTFDDTNSSQISNYSALQALNDKGNNVRYTFFLWTNKSTEMGSSVWPQAVKDGHELGNHTNSHQSAANSSDIQTAETTIKSKFNVTAYSFAAPNGDASYETVVPPMKILTTNRTAGNSGGISMTDNPSSKQYALPCIIPATGSNASTMEGLFKNDITGGKWQIFLVHGFTGGSDSAYQPVPIAEFTATVKSVKDMGNIWIDSVGTISAYWIGGYNFSKLTATTSGTDKTWTWKTSDFATPFPPGKYLRVTTDGGTLKQGNTVLPWDDHGYYEVSLDAGTLTLSQ